MSDKSSQLILEALSRAAAGGAPLHGSKLLLGLFPATSAGRQAALRCQEEGYLALQEPAVPPGTGAKAKKMLETWGLSEKGLAYLLGQASPRQVLSDLVRALEDRTAQLDGLAADVRQTREQFIALRTNAEIALRQLVPLGIADAPGGGLNALFRNFLQGHAANGAADDKSGNGTSPSAAKESALDACTAEVVKHLTHWQSSGAIEDCPLPELFRQACANVPGLTIGRFHDSLRRLRDTSRIYLHPWTGPLHEVPEPIYAVLVGHEVSYYASLRRDNA